MKALAFRQAIAVRPDPDFHRDVDRLIHHMDRLIQGLPQRPGPAWAPSSLERTMSNPHYESDFNQMVVGGYDLARLMGPETVLVVTGTWVLSELLDRPVAELLRDEIDRRGHVARLRRAIIVTDFAFGRDEGLATHPAIAIGSPGVNAVTRDVAERGRRWQPRAGAYGAYLDVNPPRVALWGDRAEDTRDSVQRYLERPDGLTEFLHNCWR